MSRLLLLVFALLTTASSCKKEDDDGPGVPGEAPALRRHYYLRYTDKVTGENLMNDGQRYDRSNVRMREMSYSDTSDYPAKFFDDTVRGWLLFRSYFTHQFRDSNSYKFERFNRRFKIILEQNDTDTFQIEKTGEDVLFYYNDSLLRTLSWSDPAPCHIDILK